MATQYFPEFSGKQESIEKFVCPKQDIVTVDSQPEKKQAKAKAKPETRAGPKVEQGSINAYLTVKTKPPSIPMCEHNKLCGEFVVKKKSVNCGRHFYACKNLKKCNFFKWNI
jgi:hypothetical protein